MKIKRCCFIGQSDAPDLASELDEVVKKLMEKGINTFLSGGMGNFDKMGEKTVKSNNGILVFIPYNDSQIKVDTSDYYSIIYSPNKGSAYHSSDIPNRNKWMIDLVDIVIGYSCRSGNSAKMINYAKSKNKEVILINKK